MTASNLTPAEALAMFKDWEDSALTIYDFRHKWYVSNDPDSFALIAIAALETLLSEHEATKAKLAAYEQAEQRQKLANAMAGNAKFMAEQESKDLLRLAALREPAAAVPTLHIEPGTFLSIEPGCTVRFSERVSVRPFDGPEGHVVAAVPSDEEIRKAIYMAKNMPQPAWTISAIELVCQRIGVKL